MRSMDIDTIILMVIGVLALAISLPTIIEAIVTAGATTGASTAFTNALTISQLVLGFSLALLILAYFFRKSSVG